MTTAVLDVVGAIVRLRNEHPASAVTTDDVAGLQWGVDCGVRVICEPGSALARLVILCGKRTEDLDMHALAEAWVSELTIDGVTMFAWEEP